jgi:hypothetical protein
MRERERVGSEREREIMGIKYLMHRFILLLSYY